MNMIDKRLSLASNWLVFSYVSAAITGFLSHLLEHSVTTQIAQLIHLPSAFIYLVSLVIFTLLHTKKVLGIRRGWLISSGVLLTLILLLQIASGLILLWQGVRADNVLLQTIHIQTSLISFAIMIVHYCLHKVSGRKTKRTETHYQFNPFILIGFTTIIFIAVLLGLSNHFTQQPYLTTAAVDNYQYPYGQHPFRPSHTETDQQQFIDSRALDTTQKCASCHQDIANQWQVSAHSQAASDKSYETNVTLLAKTKGIAATRYCEGCHAPLALLPGQLSPGGQHAGIENTLANQEGVNCQSCHGIKKLVHNKGVASYHFSVNAPYLFETAALPILQSFNKLALRFQPEQHKKDMAADVIRTAEYCAACHSQFIDKEVNNWGWIKMQDEYAAWLSSPYSGMNDKTFSHSEVKRCQDCHMPLVASKDPAAKNGLVRDHSFLAANSMLTTLNNDSHSQAKIEKFMQSNKIRISIEPPHRKQATKSQLPLKAWLRRSAQQPYYWYRGEQAKVKLVVANIGVGHNFPGGTIDINQAWVAIQVVDAEGQPIFQQGNLDSEGYLDPNAYQYRSLPVDRHGDIVWKHDLFNMVGKASVNVIPAGQADVVEVSFKVPYWAVGPLSISAQVNYRKFNTRYAKWALQDEYKPLPIITLSRAYLEIPIREKQEAF